MELLLNLIWVAISGAALLAWVSWRRNSRSRSAPEMVRGLMVLVCVLALLFPVISISDDLSQTLSLAEGTRLQDVLKAPELRGIYYLATMLPSIPLTPVCQSAAVARNVCIEVPAIIQHILWIPSIEKRPPPPLA